MTVLDSLKGKNVEVKVRELSSMKGKLIDYDDLYIVIQAIETEKGKPTVTIYYIPHFNIIYISPI